MVALVTARARKRRANFGGKVCIAKDASDRPGAYFNDAEVERRVRTDKGITILTFRSHIRYVSVRVKKVEAETATRKQRAHARRPCAKLREWRVAGSRPPACPRVTFQIAHGRRSGQVIKHADL